MRTQLFLVTLSIVFYCLSAVCFAFRFVYHTGEIYNLIENSDLVIVGSVENGHLVDGANSSAFLYTVLVDKVLYVNPAKLQIGEAIFSTDDLERINRTLSRSTPKHIYAIQPLPSGGMGSPMYFPDTEFLYFFKVSDFLNETPNSYLGPPMDLFLERNQPVSPNRTQVASLNQEFFFEATIISREATLNLTRQEKYTAEWLSYTETLGKAMSIHNLEQKERRLVKLSKSSDGILAYNAKRHLRTLRKAIQREQLRARQVRSNRKSAK